MNNQIAVETICIFSALDQLLKEHKNNKELFKRIFQRKKTLIEYLQTCKIDATKYKKIVVKTYKLEDKLLKQCAAADMAKLSDPKDENAVYQWFKQMVDETGKEIDEQQELYNKYNSTNQSKIAPLSSIKTSVVQTQLKKTNKVQVTQENINEKEVVSLRAADSLLMVFENNATVYEHILDRKMRLLALIDKKALSAEKYKKTLELTLPKINTEDIAFETKLQLQALDDFHNGDLEPWFNQVVEEAKETLRDQKKTLLTLNPSLKSGILASSQGNRQSINLQKSNSGPKDLKKSEIKAYKGVKINQIYNFKIIEDLLNDHVQDQAMYKELTQRKQQLLQEYKKGSLTAQKYKTYLEKHLKDCQDENIKAGLDYELSLIKDIHDGDVKEWFKDIVEMAQYIEIEIASHEQGSRIIEETVDNKKTLQEPVKKSQIKKSVRPGTQLGQTIRTTKSTTEKKQTFFLKQMSAYQSFLFLHKKHHIPYDTNHYLVQYEKKIKRNVQNYLNQIQKNQQIDVNKLTSELFPPINEKIFYGGQLDIFKNDVRKMIACFEQEYNILKNYSGNIKKATNVQNLQKVKKEMSQCTQSIEFLKRWPQRKFEPVPSIKLQKIKKYNMDQNKLQADELQLSVLSIEGLSEPVHLQIYIQDQKQPLTEEKVQNGNQKDVKVVAKLSETAYTEVMKGKGKHIKILLVNKGFFGAGEIVGQAVLDPIFTRYNTRQCKAQIGGVTIQCLAKVRLPTQPLVTQVDHYTLVKYPPYEHSKFVEEETVKKHMMYYCPTHSQIEP